MAAVELDPVAVGLKFGFLAVLYLFLLWVARSALKDLRRGTDEAYAGPPADYEEATGLHSASGPVPREGGLPKLRALHRGKPPKRLVSRAYYHTPLFWLERG